MKVKAKQEITLKKLMRIIYDKQKQIDKYKKILKYNKYIPSTSNTLNSKQKPNSNSQSKQKNSNTSKYRFDSKDASYGYHPYAGSNYLEEQNYQGTRRQAMLRGKQASKIKDRLVEPPCLGRNINTVISSGTYQYTEQNQSMGLTHQQHYQITKQIMENRKFFQTATTKLAALQAKINQLQTDLQQQENRNQLLQEQIYAIKLECQDKDKQILEIKTVRDILEGENVSLRQLLEKERERYLCKEKQDRQQNENYKKQQKQKQTKIHKLIIENKKIRIISQQISAQNNKLKQKLRSIQNTVNKQLKFMSRHLRMYNGINVGTYSKNIITQNNIGNACEEEGGKLQLQSNCSVFGGNIGRVRIRQRQQIKSNFNILLSNQNKLSKISQNPQKSHHQQPKQIKKQIKTFTHITQSRIQRSLQQKIKQIIQSMKKWQQFLLNKQQEWKANFQKSLSQHSFGGISNLIGQSFLIFARDSDNLANIVHNHANQLNNKDDNKIVPLSINIKNQQKSDSRFYQTSVYKRNQQQLLKQLQKQCQKSLQGPISIQKQKLVQLSEVKQSLKMTKQVNQQLFDQLNKKQNIIKICKQTIKSLQDKKLIKNQSQGKQQLKKLRTVLGVLS